MIELLQYPFMQRAVLAGVVLAALLAYLGVFVILRRMAFFSDGLAHGSLAGVAAGVLFGVNPLGTALLASIIFAAVVFFLEKKINLTSDSIIGLLFTTGMALGVLLMSFKRGYQPELIGFLFGDILAVRRTDLIIILFLSVVVGLFFILNSRKITLLSIDSEMAHLSGVKTGWYEFAMYVALAVSVVLGIKILGVVLVSALLIIPVSIAKLISRSFGALILWSVVFSEAVVLLGIFISCLFNLPTGAAIVLTGAGLFFTLLFFRRKGL
jgi:ABC-type Mn2+/Zn2+ transport system permease subunit